MESKLEQSIKILLNMNEDEGSRDDIAMDLSENDDPVVFNALLAVAENHTDSQIVKDSCIESLAQILYRNKKIKTNLDRIGIINLTKAVELIKKQRNDIYFEFELDKLE